MITKHITRPLILLLLIQGGLFLLSPTCNAAKGCCCQIEGEKNPQWDWGGGVDRKCKNATGKEGRCGLDKLCKGLADQAIEKAEKKN